MPGVSNHSSASPPSMRRRAPSTWRVVPGLSATSPKRVSRVSVRSSEVLPVLVCPTTAMRIRNQPCPVSSQSSALADAASTACAGRPSAASCARHSARAGPSSCAGSSSQTRVCCACAASSAISVSVPGPASGGRRRRSGGARRRRRPARRGCGGVPRACRAGRRSGCRRGCGRRPGQVGGQFQRQQHRTAVQPGRRRRGQARLVQRVDGRSRPVETTAGSSRSRSGVAGQRGVDAQAGEPAPQHDQAQQRGGQPGQHAIDHHHADQP